MKLVANVEVSRADEIVISKKIFYVYDKEQNLYILDTRRSKPSVVSDEETVHTMTREEMADTIREFVGNRKWIINIASDGTINIFKEKKRREPHVDYTKSVKEKKPSKK